ncbi:unnamed protein product [Sphenostylis stenocarpa]|uniref:Uncharacterized protein n=1 Tax=Sphenostylis stenocarpa TaxID=92480 RepID=A0AA86SVM6_9FABA|nr:unnamed protein product [Sphenostylis stenocarpa]
MTGVKIEVLSLGRKHRGNDRKEMVLWVSEKRQEPNQGGWLRDGERESDKQSLGEKKDKQSRRKENERLDEHRENGASKRLIFVPCLYLLVFWYEIYCSGGASVMVTRKFEEREDRKEYSINLM